MVAAMVVGMATLFPLWTAVVARSDASWLAATEVQALAMATAMVVPMAGWMVVRGHGAAAVIEMSLAMYAGFVALFPLLWSDVIDRAALLGLGHVAMLLLMALVMVRRPQQHLHRT
jgi:hypothetical protein